MSILLRYNARDPFTIDSGCDEPLETRHEDSFGKLSVVVNEIVQLVQRLQD